MFGGPEVKVAMPRRRTVLVLVCTGIVAGGAAIWLLLSQVQVTGETASERWLGFSAFLGAQLVCSSHVVGQSEGRWAEISFSLYSSVRGPREVAEFYAKAHGLALPAGQDSLDVNVEGDRKLLSVVPITGPRPSCGAEPKAGAQTIIVVSVMTR